MQPRHPKARALLESGLFNDLTRFAELESRLLAIPDPEWRQAAFALLAEGVLTARSLHRAVEVWHAGHVPMEARRRWSLPEALPGADGFFRSLEGEVHVFHLLLVEERERIGQEEAARFAGLATQTLQPLLFTNGDRLPVAWKRLPPFHCIRGVDLDRLEPRFFPLFRRWLQGAGAAVERPVMPPHHAAALERIQALLTTGDRASLTLSPGNEPELLMLRLIQRLGGRRTVVTLLPDGETLLNVVRAWRSHAGWGDLAALQVAGEGEIVHPEPDFPVTRHPDGVRRFLCWSHAGTRVVLASRAAVPMLARALLGFPQPDLLIGLETPDEGLPAGKRCLFRFPGPGNIGEILPLPRPWQLLLLPVSDAPLAGLVAEIFAWAAQQETMRRIHLLVPDAAEVSAPDSWEWLRPTREQTRDRIALDRLFHAFGQARRGVLVHSASLLPFCPPADLVILTTPPKAGQFGALLGSVLTPGTGPGCLLVPVVMQEDGFGENRLLQETLRGLLELDGGFAELVRSVMEAWGREERRDDETLTRRLRVLSPVWERPLLEACLGHLGDPWDRRFGELQAYRRQHGDCAVPAHLPERPELAEWVARLRKAGPDVLSAARLARLEEIGFVWDLEAYAWDQECRRLERFAAIHGHARIPEHYEKDPRLSEWCNRQRLLWRRERLAPERIARLHGIRFVWDLEEAAWEDAFSQFLQFKKWRGHGKLPNHHPEDVALGKWAERQRREWSLQKLNPTRQERLTGAGFVWDLEAAAWEEMFWQLQAHRERHGHGRVPKEWPEAPGLAVWAEEQRRLRERGTMPEARQVRLDEMGFVWDLEAWEREERFSELVRYRERHGHVEVVEPCAEFPLLPAWVHAQRRGWLKGSLPEAWVARLEGLGFVWDPVEKRWNDGFVALTAFHAGQGHFHVPGEWPPFPELPEWVKAQRTAREKGRLPADKLARLEAIGFVWDAREAAWEERLLALRRFRERRNHCLVPAQWSGDPELARWVEQQRRDYRTGKLPDARITRLEELGFLWDAKVIFWEEMYAALGEYREQHGDCLVPEGYAAQSQLAWWVAAQRKARVAGQLEEERLRRLDAIGFVWDAQEADWRESLRLLEGFHARFGHCAVPADWPENPRLASWVVTQRNARLKGHLTREHEAALSALGMIWDPREAVAEEMMQQLITFRATHGHCEVPLDHPDHARLGLWLQFQRQACKDGTLDASRQRRLTAIGVEWKISFA
ncbi:MAG: helicase associated domain-containing protein [Magnetococcales bacterium]|nr:helicase associated domain-containing protein [Magnetococcales bacterium]